MELNGNICRGICQLFLASKVLLFSIGNITTSDSELKAIEDDLNLSIIISCPKIAVLLILFNFKFKNV